MRSLRDGDRHTFGWAKSGTDNRSRMLWWFMWASMVMESLSKVDWISIKADRDLYFYWLCIDMLFIVNNKLGLFISFPFLALIIASWSPKKFWLVNFLSRILIYFRKKMDSCNRSNHKRRVKQEKADNPL